jgi:hypothetical protein
LPPVSSLSWAENELRFPARFAKNRTSSVVYGQFNAFITSSLLPFFLPCLLGKKQTRSLLTHSCEPDRTHVERAKHWSTIIGACGQLSTDQLQSVKKLCLSRLGSAANGFSPELRLLAREIRNASPLGNHEVAQAGLE